MYIVQIIFICGIIMMCVGGGERILFSMFFSKSLSAFWSELTSAVRLEVSPNLDDSNLLMTFMHCWQSVYRHVIMTVTFEYQQHQGRLLLRAKHTVSWKHCFFFLGIMHTNTHTPHMLHSSFVANIPVYLIYCAYQWSSQLLRKYLWKN